jgi:hypothetical protein
MTMNTDPAIETTRRAREDICSSCDHDPAKVIAYYLEMQRRFGDRLQHGPPEEQAGAEAGLAGVGAEAEP